MRLWAVTELTAATLVQRGITHLTGRSDSPRRDAEVLSQAACGIDRTALAKNPNSSVDAAAADTYFDFLNRRDTPEPVACILGHKEFWSLDIELNASTLVPRPETELLVETALDAIPAGTAVEIADLGTGSGALLLSALARLPPALLVLLGRSRDSNPAPCRACASRARGGCR